MVDGAGQIEQEHDDSSSNAVTAATANAFLGKGSGTLPMIVLVVCIAMVSGAIGAVAMDIRQPPPPKVLVLDMASLLDPIANDPALSAYEKRRLTEDLGAALNRAMQAEAEEGAIIVDASMVLMAPGSSYVQPF